MNTRQLIRILRSMQAHCKRSRSAANLTFHLLGELRTWGHEWDDVFQALEGFEACCIDMIEVLEGHVHTVNLPGLWEKVCREFDTSRADKLSDMLARGVQGE